MPEKKRSFWTSLPGLVTGVAAIITTITVLYLAIVRPPDKPPIEEGVYTIQQKSNRRYLDAYLDAKMGYNVVTRESQNHDSQSFIQTNDYSFVEQQLGIYAHKLDKVFDETVGKELPDDPLLVRADMNSPFKYVQKLIFFCAQPNTQIWKIQLAAKETDEAKAARKAAEGR